MCNAQSINTKLSILIYNKNDKARLAHYDYIPFSPSRDITKIGKIDLTRLLKRIILCIERPPRYSVMYTGRVTTTAVITTDAVRSLYVRAGRIFNIILYT